MDHFLAFRGLTAETISNHNGARGLLSLSLHRLKLTLTPISNPGRQQLIRPCWNPNEDGEEQGFTFPQPSGVLPELDRSKGCAPTTLVNQHTEDLARTGKAIPSAVLRGNLARPTGTAKTVRSSPEPTRVTYRLYR